MEENKYVIGEKEYTREELLIFGKQHYPKFYWIPRGVGLGLMLIFGLIGAIYFGMGLAFKGDEYAETASKPLIIIGVVMFVFAFIGFIVFLTSFAKQSEEAYIKHAVDSLNKQYENQKAREARIQQREAKAARKEENRDISQLLKYKELLDAGIITQEEFDQKKKELL